MKNCVTNCDFPREISTNNNSVFVLFIFEDETCDEDDNVIGGKFVGKAICEDDGDDSQAKLQCLNEKSIFIL